MTRKDWTVIQVPYGGGYSSLNLAYAPNTRKAPSALKEEFARQKIFMADNGVISLPNGAKWLEINLGFGYQNNINGWEKMRASVLSCLNVLDWKSDTNVLFLGGSHTITASTYPGVAGSFGRKNMGLVLLDAHPDCCFKANWPIHSDWLRGLVEDEHVMSENVLIVGLRQIEKSEKEFLDRFNIKHYPMNNIQDVENFTINDFSVMRSLAKLQSLSATYMSIDIDVASGVHAPGTGCPSPGGFTDRELIGLVKRFKAALPNLRAADIVEINPLNWWQKKILRYDATVDLGVKLIKEIIS